MGSSSSGLPLARYLVHPANELPRDPDGASAIASDEVWDAGDRGCGELVLELRMRLGARPAGHVLLLIARDLGAPADLPAWCRMTGNALLSSDHPVYYIQRGT